MLGNQLGRRGVRTVIIDRHPGPSVQTKALGVQARTLEIYARLGIAERALELGTRTTGANMWTGGRKAARVPIGDIGRDLSPYPFLLILGQDDNERLLGEVLRHWGIEVQWSTELVGLVQGPEDVSATLKQADGSTREIKAKWICGCDGAHSAVRSFSGIAFRGAPYEHVFFVADTTLTGPMVPGELNVFLFRDGFHLFFPMRGAHHWRLVGIVPKQLRTRDDLDFASVIPSIRQQIDGTLSFQDCHWFSTYRIHHRRAERFRDRRCFLLGDAAHIHSPVGAQGMNTGLQDAYNLAWKLALVVSGHAGPALLDSYEIERVPVAERLLETTDQAFSVIVSDRWLAGIFRTRLLAKLLAIAMIFDRIRKLAFRTISQIGIHYRRSSLSETLPGFPRSAPQAGDRFPWLKIKFTSNAPTEDLFTRLDDTRFNLIVIGQPSLSAGLPKLPGLIHIIQIPDDLSNDREFVRAGIPNPSFYLLRPDGHIGLTGIHPQAPALTRYLGERMEVRA
jgi:2-polyprenyl-6-methoxyphenol hydroxylase-like FAD-dependent oxidoreductase